MKSFSTDTAKSEVKLLSNDHRLYALVCSLHSRMRLETYRASGRKVESSKPEGSYL
jgi:hypothetical protein